MYRQIQASICCATAAKKKKANISKLKKWEEENAEMTTAAILFFKMSVLYPHLGCCIWFWLLYQKDIGKTEWLKEMSYRDMEKILSYENPKEWDYLGRDEEEGNSKTTRSNDCSKEK